MTTGPSQRLSFTVYLMRSGTAHPERRMKSSEANKQGSKNAATVSVARLAGQIVSMVIVFSAALFVPAGTLNWPSAWSFLAIMFGSTTALSAWLMRFDPDLLAERMSGIGKSDQKLWDKVLLGFVGAAFFGWLALAGLDRRFSWSNMAIWLQLAGAVLLTLSFALFFLTFRENSYLSPAVRVQRERGQRVVSSGPYAYVRHPMYDAFAGYAIGTALLLGSWPGVAGALVLIGLVAYRAVFEERVLRAELAGYEAYTARVRWRLFPRIW
jgi:protein-S-isoprenylcysteine O-methyltransferase Ste14